VATYYSDHFMGATHADLDTQLRASAGIEHGRLRYQRAEITQLVAVTEVVRMMQFKSSDRIFQLFVTTSAADSAGVLGIGLRKTGREHDGADLDVNCIASGLSMSSRLDFTDAFMLVGDPTIPLYRGRMLWELLDAGSLTYAEDPMEDWDLTIVAATGFNAERTVVLEAYYTSGD